ncbi:UDP-N-acetylmuramate--L-alanine ligase [Aureivirga sp. CE67]|uniref:UDP-N-acetylmuramate--L-alanine ligase n=1 Tax=Aureivirga sp. CE67 TaxID=1788983 RepID=UPI0018CA8F25|nr:UDP-N-acetylmuramate--L-alanine ligase [Aureivirga sp. CE67]
MNLTRIHTIYFIGIGGIGMSSLARYFKNNNKLVAGYDRTSTPITNALQQTGITINFEDRLDVIPAEFLEPATTLVVYTPAIPKDHKQFNYFKENGFHILKRAEVLGEITRDSLCLAVAGTHGKTTTSTMLGHILHDNGINATAFLGGISENYNSNLILGGDEISVVEADEFDRSFMKLFPDVACITSMDADHLDIYGNKEELESTFVDFSNNVKRALFVEESLLIEGIKYGFSENAKYRAINLQIRNGVYTFDLVSPNTTFYDIELPLPGMHNVKNALAAIAMASEYGVSIEKIAASLKRFKGIQRRFSYKINTENFVLIDDYAHHPTEINAVIDTAREMYPGKKVLGVFQPHLFSRTLDFADDFAESLSKFDELILLDIYPARELPIEGVNSSWLLDKVTLDSKKLGTKENVYTDIKESDAEVVLMLGAGDIGEVIKEVQSKFENEG